MSLYLVKTPNGHVLPEAISAFQKCVRRGLVDDALYWGVDVYKAGYHEYAWKRMRIMASEDVGLADRTLPATLEALYVAFSAQLKKKDEANAPERLFFIHAVMLLATAPKSRAVDHALIYHFAEHGSIRREVPDFALDKHTMRGKQLGRGVDHFFDVGASLDNKSDVADAYADLARQAMKRNGTAEPQMLTL